MYQIIDRQTQEVVATAPTLKAARRKVDRLDNAYGGYHYFARKAQS